MDREQPSDLASSANRPALDAATTRAVRSILSRLKGDFAPVDVLVFGSRARGDHHDESDIDVAVVLKGAPGDRYEALIELSDVAYDVLLETWLRIPAFPALGCRVGAT